MSDVAMWRLFAFKDDDDGHVSDEVRTVPEWRLDDTLRWCRTRGYDNIYLRRLPDQARFERKPAPEGVTHSG